MISEKEILKDELYGDIRTACEIEKYKSLNADDMRDILNEIKNDYCVHKIFFKN